MKQIISDKTCVLDHYILSRLCTRLIFLMKTVEIKLVKLLNVTKWLLLTFWYFMHKCVLLRWFLNFRQINFKSRKIVLQSLICKVRLDFIIEKFCNSNWLSGDHTEIMKYLKKKLWLRIIKNSRNFNWYLMFFYRRCR